MKLTARFIVLSALLGVVGVVQLCAQSSAVRLVNLSTRGRVTTSSPLISGFAIAGTASRPVLVRAAGPGLAGFGVASALAAPRLQLRDVNGALVMENAGWADATALADAFAQAGAFPFARGSTDAALSVTLAPGNYTMQVSDASGGDGGIALAEVYDLGAAATDSRLVNVSTRSTVAASGGELISGFVLAGTAPRNFLVRGVGPGLVKFGVNGTLANPAVALFNSTGREVASNDDWSGGNQVSSFGPVTPANGVTPLTPTVNPDQVRSAAKTVGAFDLDLYSYDAALVTSLAPGAYTVHVKGNSTMVVTTSTLNSSAVNGSAQAATVAVSISFVPPSPGVALLEIYELP